MIERLHVNFRYLSTIVSGLDPSFASSIQGNYRVQRSSDPSQDLALHEPSGGCIFYTLSGGGLLPASVSIEPRNFGSISLCSFWSSPVGSHEKLAEVPGGQVLEAIAKIRGLKKGSFSAVFVYGHRFLTLPRYV